MNWYWRLRFLLNSDTAISQLHDAPPSVRLEAAPILIRAVEDFVDGPGGYESQRKIVCAIGILGSLKQRGVSIPIAKCFLKALDAGIRSSASALVNAARTALLTLRDPAALETLITRTVILQQGPNSYRSYVDELTLWGDTLDQLYGNWQSHPRTLSALNAVLQGWNEQLTSPIAAHRENAKQFLVAAAHPAVIPVLLADITAWNNKTVPNIKTTPDKYGWAADYGPVEDVKRTAKLLESILRRSAQRVTPEQLQGLTALPDPLILVEQYACFSSPPDARCEVDCSVIRQLAKQALLARK